MLLVCGVSCFLHAIISYTSAEDETKKMALSLLAVRCSNYAPEGDERRAAIPASPEDQEKLSWPTS